MSALFVHAIMLTLPMAVILAGLTTQEYNVEAFHGISIAGDIKATVSKGAKLSVKLTSTRETLDKMSVLVKRGILEIESKSGLWGDVKPGTTHHDRPNDWHMDKITAEIVTPAALDSVDISGGVTLTGSGFSGSKCEIDASGGADLSLQSVSCELLNLDASGGAVVKLQGSAKRLDLDASGGVELKMTELATQQAKIDASGGVTGKVAVAEKLDADLSGGVDLQIKGHPRVGHSETSGGVSLKYVD